MSQFIMVPLLYEYLFDLTKSLSNDGMYATDLKFESLRSGFVIMQFVNHTIQLLFIEFDHSTLKEWQK